MPGGFRGRATGQSLRSVNHRQLSVILAMQFKGSL